MFCCLIPHFLFKKHFWKCDRNDYSESYTIELEHFIKHFTFSAKPQDFGRNEISKYRLSDLNLSSSRKTLNYFEVTKIEAWNPKTCVWNHHLHNPNYPNQWASPWLLESSRSCVIVKSLIPVVIFSQGLFPRSWGRARGPKAQGKARPHGQVYAL